MEHSLKKPHCSHDLSRVTYVYAGMNILLLYGFAFLQMIMTNFIIGLPIIAAVFCMAMNILCILFFQLRLASAVYCHMMSS